MTLVVEINPEVEARLAEEARVRGVAPGEYAGKLLNDALGATAGGSGKPTKKEFHAMLDALAQDSEKLPDLPISVFTRESFYEDGA